MEETKMRLNLVIAKKSQKVLYAEGGKTFVDFLFHLLTLPVGTVIMHLTEKGMMGCLADLYEGVENLCETCMQHSQSKDPLLGPLYNWSSCVATPKKLYVCSTQCYAGSHHPSAVCSNCRGTMTNQTRYVYSVNEKVVLSTEEGGYVNGSLTYMITDALVVKPLSTMSIVNLLNKSNINDAVLEEKVVDFTMKEVLKLLLNASLHSKTALTDVFLRNAEAGHKESSSALEGK